jgi:hypothetical protein
MEIIFHRINSVKELEEIPLHAGVEIDVRDYNDELILQHEPFVEGELLEPFLKKYGQRKGNLILNIKSERIEIKILDLLKKYKIENYFFLDSSFPMIINLLNNYGEKKIALRYSEFEKEDTILGLAGKIEWIWIDCFSKIPGTPEIYAQFRKLGFKLCFVSPDLQNQSDKIKEYKIYFRENKIYIDAVCTKLINLEQWTK